MSHVSVYEQGEQAILFREYDIGPGEPCVRILNLNSPRYATTYREEAIRPDTGRTYPVSAIGAGLEKTERLEAF